MGCQPLVLAKGDREALKYEGQFGLEDLNKGNSLFTSVRHRSSFNTSIVVVTHDLRVLN